MSREEAYESPRDGSRKVREVEWEELNTTSEGREVILGLGSAHWTACPAVGAGHERGQETKLYYVFAALSAKLSTCTTW